MQLFSLEEPFQCAPSAVGAKRSSEDPPQVSTRPSVQELQGALSLGNGKIIKQVTSGTCFSEATSGRDNSVSVSDGRGFPGLATVCAQFDWLAAAGTSFGCSFLPTRSSLCLYPELPTAAPSQQGPRAGARVGRRNWGDPGDLPAPGLRQGNREGHSVRWAVGCSVPAMRAMEKTREWKGWEFFTGVSLLRKHPKAPFLLNLGFFPRSCLSTSAQAAQKSCLNTGHDVQVAQSSARHTRVAQIWLSGITLGLNGFILEAAANLPSKPHPSLQPGILQVTVIFQFAEMHIVFSEFAGPISTLL